MALSAAEQLMIEMINRARLDPLGEAARFGIDLNEGLSADTLDGTPRQALAPNDLLHASSEAHSNWMLANDIFSHTGANGSSPGDRMAAAGYEFTGRYANGENLTWRGSTGSIDLDTLMEENHHKALFLSSGHRANMLSDFYREIGVSQQAGIFTSSGRDYNASMVTVNFALSGAPVFLTGVSYADTDGDGFYSIGEAQAGVSVAAAGQSVRTDATGGYAIALAATSQVDVRLGGIALNVDLSQGNGKLDLVGTDGVLTSVDTVLEGAAGSLRALGVADIALTGHDGADVLIGNDGDNVLDGRGGTDAVWYDMDFDQARITKDAGGIVTVVSAAGTDTLRNIETVAFTDRLVALDQLFNPTPTQPIPTPPTPPTPTLAHSGVRLTGTSGDNRLYSEGFSADLAPGTAAQVYRLYQAALDRTPDLAGHTGWTRLIVEGTRALEDVARGFVASPEFTATYGALDSGGFVDLLYDNVLDRAADAAGRSGWVSLLEEGGMSRAQVIIGFSESPEFVRATMDQATAYTRLQDVQAWTDDVFRLYQATLGRAPDAGGFDAWTDSLSGGMAFTDVVSGFVGSREFKATYGTLEDAGFVDLLYGNVLGRTPDAAGRQGWLDTLAGGKTRVDVVTAFVQSAEFVNKTQDAVRNWVVARGLDDVLEGGAGNDLLAGGALADAFVFDAAAPGRDRVLDLETWDRLYFNGFDYADVAELRSHLTQSGSDVVFDDQGVQVTFAGTTLAMLSDDMILV
tara:strand:- start:1925 stop:4156 length:2232 start_codon:yes stop_codon:yes gene_type:complete